MNYNTIHFEDLGVTVEYASFCPTGGVGEWHVMLHVESRREAFEEQLRRIYEAEDRFDIISIVGTEEPFKITHFPDAFNAVSLSYYRRY